MLNLKQTEFISTAIIISELVYSEDAARELDEIAKLDLDLLDEVVSEFTNRVVTMEQWSALKKAQRKIVRLSSEAQSNHMERLRDGKCSFEQGLTFVESLNSLSRIANHITNIAEMLLGAEVGSGLPAKDERSA